MNIYAKLLKITSELPAVAKNLFVGVGKSSYKAVGEADVLSAIKPLEEKYGVYSYPASRKIIDSSITVNEEGKKTYFERIETVYRFVNIDEPSDYIEITSYGDGIDSGDKSVGKGMTYADKYALLKAYKIITGDDPDQNASNIEDNQEVEKVQKKTDDEFVPMTQQQKDLIVRLFNEKDAIPSKVYETLNIDRKHCSKQEASKLIDFLMKCPPKKTSTTLKEVSKTVDDVRIEPTTDQETEDNLVADTEDDLPF